MKQDGRQEGESERVRQRREGRFRDRKCKESKMSGRMVWRKKTGRSVKTETVKGKECAK